MMFSFSRIMASGLILLAFLCGLFIPLPSAQAAESTKMVLFEICDRSGYNDPNLNATLLTKLRSQFRFPKYEIAMIPAAKTAIDRPTLERIVADKAADGAVALEIGYLRNFTIYLRDEILEETDLTLFLTYYDKKSGQYGQFKANRSATEIMGIYSGPQPLALDALEELLNRLDKVFPRQFPGPRY